LIFSHILGGIGNQMFQYAAGRSLSYFHKQPFLLDLNDFEFYKLHNGFELQRIFNIAANIGIKSDLREILGWQRNSLINKVLRQPQFKSLRSRNFVVEPHFNYWSDFFKSPTNAYLRGYWQSELYFKSIQNLIREEFKFKIPLSGENAKLAKLIQSQKSVSLHVRRGDYLTHLKTSRIMSTCSIDYYEKAVDLMSSKIQSPVFYVFSDDICWTKKNISMPHPCVYIDHNNHLESYRDMQLMSLCQHHIIANSSFSWWGAWLGQNSSKIVIAPKVWFKNGTNDSDLVPNRWIRL
jgi:hypothetical protein